MADDCPHDHFDAHIGIQRLGDDDGHITNFLAEITVKCVKCGVPFHFKCPDTGISFTKPTVNVGATTLHAPMAPGEAPLPSSVRFDLAGMG